MIKTIPSASVTGESMNGSHIADSSTLVEFRRSARYELPPHQKLEVKGPPAVTRVIRCVHCMSLTHPTAPGEASSPGQFNSGVSMMCKQLRHLAQICKTQRGTASTDEPKLSVRPLLL